MEGSRYQAPFTLHSSSWVFELIRNRSDRVHRVATRKLRRASCRKVARAFWIKSKTWTVFPYRKARSEAAATSKSPSRLKVPLRDLPPVDRGESSSYRRASAAFELRMGEVRSWEIDCQAWRSKLLLLFGVTSTWGSLPAADGLGRAWFESGLLNGAGAVSSSGSPREGVSLRLAGLRKACCSTCTDITVAQQEAVYLSHVSHESLLVTEVGDVHLGEVLQAQPGQVSPAQERASALGEVQQEGLLVLLEAHLAEPLPAVDLSGSVCEETGPQTHVVEEFARDVLAGSHPRPTGEERDERRWTQTQTQLAEMNYQGLRWGVGVGSCVTVVPRQSSSR